MTNPRNVPLVAGTGESLKEQARHEEFVVQTLEDIQRRVAQMESGVSKILSLIERRFPLSADST